LTLRKTERGVGRSIIIEEKVNINPLKTGRTEI